MYYSQVITLESEGLEMYKRVAQCLISEFNTTHFVPVVQQDDVGGGLQYSHSAS